MTDADHEGNVCFVSQVTINIDSKPTSVDHIDKPTKGYKMEFQIPGVHNIMKTRLFKYVESFTTKN